MAEQPESTEQPAAAPETAAQPPPSGEKPSPEAAQQPPPAGTAAAPGQKEGSDRKVADMPAVQALIRTFGQIVNNINLYSVRHKVTITSLQQAYRDLCRLLETTERIDLTLTEDSLLADGRRLDEKNPLIGAFIKQLREIDAAGFSLDRGMAWEEFAKLMQLLSMHPDKLKEMGSFSQAVSQVNLKHVKARTVTYQIVTEEDVVMKRGNVDGTTGAGEGEGDSAENILAQLLAFLEGKGVELDEEAIRDLTQIAVDPAKLAELIMRAASDQQQEKGEGPETLVDLVVQCLRRTYESLLQDPAANTQTGKKALTKTLQQLQEELVKRIHDIPGAADETADQAVGEAVDEMTTELAIESLATEYVKKHKGIETVENKILRFLKRRKSAEDSALEELRSRLMESGLGFEEWHELLMKSGATQGAGGADGAVALLGLLSQLDQMLGKAAKTRKPAPEEEVDEVVGEIGRQVAEITVGTEQKLEALSQQMEQLAAAEAEEKPGSELAMSRRALFTLLAEIVQELCQPLSVVNASVDMLRQRFLGEITPQQEEMLNLVAESGERLKMLTDRLLGIVGVPVSTKPDAGIIEPLYDR